MPDLLFKIPFTGELQPLVADFFCGNEEWERPLADWIKAAPNIKGGALYEVKKKRCDVWLHVNTARQVIAYSSLGSSRWRWPERGIVNSCG